MTKPGINAALNTTWTLGKPKCVNRCLGRVNFISGEIKSDVCNAHQQRTRSHKNCERGVLYVVTDQCIDHKTFESRSIFRVYNLDQQAF